MSILKAADRFTTELLGRSATFEAWMNSTVFARRDYLPCHVGFFCFGPIYLENRRT